MTEVVAALIWNDEGDKLLICQRPSNKARALCWEFVGGKVERGETHRQALIRECREELDILLSVGEPYAEVLHSYPDIEIHLTLFCARIVEGTPTCLEHNALCWVSPKELSNYHFCPADDEIIAKIGRDFA